MDGKELRSLRKGLGLTQHQFGNLIGVHPRTVRKWEGEEQPIPPTVVALGVLLTHEKLGASAMRALVAHFVASLKQGD